MPNWKDCLDPAAPSGRYLRWKEVERSAGISRTTAWRLQRAGEFPRPYVISPGRVGYLEAEVDAWRTSRGHRAGACVAPAHRPAPPEPAPEPAPRVVVPAGAAAVAPAAARRPARQAARRAATGRRASPDAQMQLDL